MKKYLPVLVRLFISTTYIFSGYTKLMEPPDRFFEAVLGYQLIGGWQAHAVAWIFPWAELVLGVFFLAGLWMEMALAGLWLMNLSFIAAIGSVLLRKIPLENCGCFGESFIQLPLPQVLLMDWMFLICFVYLAIRRQEARKGGLDHFIQVNSRKVQ